MVKMYISNISIGVLRHHRSSLLISLLRQPSTITCCDWSDRNCGNIDNREPPTPTEQSFQRIPRWLTLSDAALKSICLPRTRRQGDQIRDPATPTRDASLRPIFLSTRLYITGMKPRSGHFGSRTGLKPKPQVKRIKFYKSDS